MDYAYVIGVQNKKKKLIKPTLFGKADGVNPYTWSYLVNKHKLSEAAPHAVNG